MRPAVEDGAIIAPPRHRLLLVLGVGVEDQLADALLRGGVDDRPQQGERSALAVDGVLAGGERDVPAAAGAAFPDGKADQLQAGERAVGEVQFGIGELAGRVALVVRGDLDGDHDGNLSARRTTCGPGGKAPRV